MNPKTSNIFLPEIIKRIYPNLTLYPPQIETIYKGLLSDKNFVISVPTATGKTLLAELAIIEFLRIKKRKKVVYLSPLRALTNEKFSDFQYLKELGISIQISTSDYDKIDFNWESVDLLLTTNEKLDSIIRSKREKFVNDIGLVIIDECHLIDDMTRGPTLEVLISQLRILEHSIKFIALSATISNANELAEWLNATLIQSSWRSVPIVQGIVTKTGTRYWENREKTQKIPVNYDPLVYLIEETLKQEGQVLIFTNNRKSTQKLAEQLSSLTNQYLTPKDRQKISDLISTSIIEDFQTEASQDLIKLLLSGISFHHAGLSNKPRELIEKSYKARMIKVIVATPTLSTGVNLPARRVILTSVWRYSNISGSSQPIKVMEYEQIRGRAGRPQFDTKGEMIIIAKTDDEIPFIREKFFNSKHSEPILSKLSSEPALRMHLLGLISTSVVSNFNDLLNFVKSTFYHYQFKNHVLINQRIMKLISLLSESGFIRIINEEIEISRIGKRTAQLYLDPLSAKRLLDGLITALNRNKLTTFSFLHLFCTVPDFRRLRIKNSNWESILEIIELNSEVLLTEIPSNVGIHYERFMTEVFTAEIIHRWIEERNVNRILKFAVIELGDLQRITDIATWICYGAKELSKELDSMLKHQQTYNMYFKNLTDKNSSEIKNKLSNITKKLELLEIRLIHGIKADLAELVQIKYVGRTRARILTKNGYTKQKLESTSIEELEKIPLIGPYYARAILSQFRQLDEHELLDNLEYEKKFKNSQKELNKELLNFQRQKSKRKEYKKTIRDFL